jgi:hypothetical protein
MKDLLRFDTIVASCALLMSSITAGAMVYQTRVLQDQFSATVWPYLNVDSTYEPTSFAVRVINQGVGPALIRSAQVSVDGKPVSGWDNEFFKTLFGTASRKKQSIGASETSMDSSTAIRAGDEFSLLKIRVSNPSMLQAAAKHHIALDFCYGSINGKYWTLHYSPGSLRADEPVAVPRCTSSSVIAAPLPLFVPPKRR